MKCKKRETRAPRHRDLTFGRRGGLLLLPLALLLAFLLAQTPASAAVQEKEAAYLEETIFLGEAVPMRIGGKRIVERIQEKGQGDFECWWVSPQGPAPLERLAQERPMSQTDYKLSAVFHTEKGDDWLDVTYRIQVVKGTLRVRAAGEGVPQDRAALFRLEGKGLTVYGSALPEADPQSGTPVLTAEFTGLPFGTYTVTAEEEGFFPLQEECLLGLCRENDTVSTNRHMAVAKFTASQPPSGALCESYRLEAGK